MNQIRNWSCSFLLFALVAPCPADEPFNNDELRARTFQLAERYFQQYQDPNTFVLYGARLATKANWTSPTEIKARKPAPWGYGSRIADTALHCGHTLVALLDAYDAAPDPFLKRNAEQIFSALKFIGQVCPIEGLVPRGPHPDDSSAYYDDSSMDQHTTYIIALAHYARSRLATPDDKLWIADKLNAIGKRLESNDFSIKAADGITQSHVGFSWKGFRNNHVSILIPTLFALYIGTGNQHWRELQDQFLAERDGLRWQQLHPGEHVELNGHPIYANQNGFRLNAYLHFLADDEKRSVISNLLAQSVQMQLDRDFPGPFYRKYHPESRWQELEGKYDWGGPQLHGALAAWKRFRTDALEEKDGLAALAHVRFPMGGFHMVLMSERDDLIGGHLPTIWQMLNAVDLQMISSAETHYLFTTVALHAYAYCHRNPHWHSDDPEYGKPLTQQLEVGVGPTMDVTIDGNHAYAIGKSALYVLDIQLPNKPKLIGQLKGLGNVRQIVVVDGVAYVGSREDGLFIVDVKEPSRPKLLSKHDTIEFATGICKTGNVLAIACRQFGVELVDVSDPIRPRHLSTVRTGEAQSVVAKDGYLYVGVWAASEVVTVDIRNPWAPKITARTPLDGYGDGVDVEGNFLYAATGHHSRKRPKRNPGDPGYGQGHGLEVLDISNPATPKPIHRIKFPGLYNIRHDMWSVTIAGSYAFVADTHNGVFIVDVTDPYRLRCVRHWKIPQENEATLPSYVGGLVPVDDFVYVAGGETDLHVLEATGIARRSAEKPKSKVTIPAQRPAESTAPYRVYRTEGQVYGVEFVGNQAIAACGTSGLHLLEVFPEFARLDQHPTADRATDVATFGERIYVAEGSAGLGIYELDDRELKEIGRYQVPNHSIKQVEVPGDGKYALVQVGIHKIQILDLTNTARPQSVLEDQHPGLLYGDQLMRGLVDDRYACAFWHVSGLHWYDLKSAGGPSYTGDHFPGRIGSGNGLIAHQGKTLAVIRGGYLWVDREERRELNDVPSYQITTENRHLGKPVIVGDRLYTTDRQTGLVTIADISSPRDPELIQQFQLPGNPSRCVVHDGVLVIPDGFHGLLVFDR